jgi:hypothetical protein
MIGIDAHAMIFIKHVKAMISVHVSCCSVETEDRLSTVSAAITCAKRVHFLLSMVFRHLPARVKGIVLHTTSPTRYIAGLTD